MLVFKSIVLLLIARIDARLLMKIWSSYFYFLWIIIIVTVAFLWLLCRYRYNNKSNCKLLKY